MRQPVRVTKDLRLIVAPDAPPLSGSQALDLGKKLLERGAIAVALEVMDRPARQRSVAAEA
jgi:hypothetical protein